MKRLLVALSGTLLLFLAGCATIREGTGDPVSPAEKWSVLPFINNTETPYAAERVESIATALLYARGVKSVLNFPSVGKQEELPVGRGGERLKEAIEWARSSGVRYALTGTVNEWRYKVGLDGEPAVGVTLQLLELPDGRVVWSGSGAMSGWSRESVSGVAQQLTERLLETIIFK